MPGAALVLVVFVSTADARDPSTAALVSAAQTALGAGTSVVVREFQRAPTDDEAIDEAHALHASAVAEIVWVDSQRLRATVHVHVDGASRWIDREVGFVAADAPTERGRTVGFTLASMLPDRVPDETPPTPPVPPPVATTSAPLPPTMSTAERARPPEAPRASRGSVEAAALGSVGVAGYGGGLGAALGVRWNLPNGFALRFSGGARAGEVAPAQSTSLFIFGAAGLAWSLPSHLTAPFGLGVRTDFLLTRLELSHLDSDDPTPDRQWRWLAGADALVEASWFFSQSAGLFANVGTELAFGRTDVYVAGATVAVVPVARGVLELGVRARF
jgi:hypothetical protein